RPNGSSPIVESGTKSRAQASQNAPDVRPATCSVAFNSSRSPCQRRRTPIRSWCVTVALMERLRGPKDLAELVSTVPRGYRPHAPARVSDECCEQEEYCGHESRTGLVAGNVED